MSSYIGKVQVESGDQILIGSTLSGICSTAANTAAKVVTLNDFDTLMKGITVHIRFVNGNSVTDNVTLAVGSTTAYPISGNCVCNAGDTIAFTYYEDTNEHTWYANTNIVAAEGTTNGTVNINGQDATVHGLGTAAYSNTETFATAAQGTLAEGAMPTTGGTFTGAVSGPAVDDTSASGTLATVDYVRTKAEALSGLTGAMHFKGEVASLPDATDSNTFTNYQSGDVVLVTGSAKEYVYNKGQSAAESSWIELGDESSFVLKTSQTSGSVGSASGWSAGSASTAIVSGGVLQLTNSVAPSLTVTSTNVVVPVITP